MKIPSYCPSGRSGEASHTFRRVCHHDRAWRVEEQACDAVVLHNMGGAPTDAPYDSRHWASSGEITAAMSDSPHT